ncbi:DUF3592 domain-containing protein [Micromonospora nigra]|uniref:DUF3592 domain-containing protein n=1 Tax=Micromonospora nigra TaxID=145857 RepID=UPI000B8992AD|nr:DUF3592 domain-containing protein [Micromonospora nigra]
MAERKPRSRWRPGYWLRHPALGVPIGAFVALLVAYLGVVSLHERNEMMARGERAVGTVRELHGRNWSASVAFTTRAGEQVIAWVGHPPWNEPYIGEDVDLSYDRDRPERAYLSGDEPGLLPVILFLGGAVALGVAQTWWLWRNWSRLRNEADAWRSRRPVPRLGARR